MAAVTHLFISCELREHFDFFFFTIPPKTETEMGSHISPSGPTPSALCLSRRRDLHLSLRESRVLIGGCARRSAWSGRSW